MPLTTDEVVNLSPKAVALGSAIAAAVRVDGDGGKKITRAEARRILKLAGQLVAALAVDIVD